MAAKTLLFILVVTIISSWAIPSRLYGLWHCGDDGCSWFKEPNTSNSQWIINRGDGKPTANFVMFSFLDPVALLHGTNDQNFANGVPKGMTKNIIDFFKSKGITVMFSIGGIEYTPKWDSALQENPSQLGKNAARVAQEFGVGIEIDYENDGDANLNNLETFVKAYRSVIPNGNSPQAILSVDMGAGVGFLTGIAKSAVKWLNGSLINFANAMVAGAPDDDISTVSTFWQQHIDGSNWNSVPPMDPSKLVVSLWASHWAKNCATFSGSVNQGAIQWVNQKKALGISFWTAGCPAPPQDCANNCPGIQAGSKSFLG